MLLKKKDICFDYIYEKKEIGQLKVPAKVIDCSYVPPMSTSVPVDKYRQIFQ